MDSGDSAEIADALGEVDMYTRGRIDAVVARLGVGAARSLVEHAIVLEGSPPEALPPGIHPSNLTGLFLQLALAELSDSYATSADEETQPRLSLPPSSDWAVESGRRRVEGDADVAKSLLRAVLEPFSCETQRQMLLDLLQTLEQREPRHAVARVKLRS